MSKSKKPPSGGSSWHFKVARTASRAFTNFTKSGLFVWRRWLPLRLFQLERWLSIPVNFPLKTRKFSFKAPRSFWIILLALLLWVLAFLLTPHRIVFNSDTLFASPPPVEAEVGDELGVDKLEWNTTAAPKGICPVLSLSYPNKTGIITRGFYASTDNPHLGIDWTTKVIDVYSSSVGEVVFSGWEGEYGLVVFVDVPGTGYQFRYAHLSQVYVLPGQEVVVGEAIGVAGKTGNATGVHLHQSLLCDGREIDFLKYFISKGVN